ncbi:hypothetical protein TraAM80_08837 [Trypanosoma rangeli]|uniref:Uncharacterized protein n=1 Tax=Trypanosoma rangeli TaxID=5698 RepID=A0A422MYK3_TRYRA|nr:uncharacterized protein TraAM80_08837 [Trypanosoma rangeli]RNE98308.1 hypothetical protein TraAM80_08837 [Trypanosoma rangeli]|eukprot:RNE98308.1 hypothetical protein TraAM80_08837 [Trypanosoma rangeli]
MRAPPASGAGGLESVAERGTTCAEAPARWAMRSPAVPAHGREEEHSGRSLPGPSPPQRLQRFFTFGAVWDAERIKCSYCPRVHCVLGGLCVMWGRRVLPERLLCSRAAYLAAGVSGIRGRGQTCAPVAGRCRVEGGRGGGVPRVREAARAAVGAPEGRGAPPQQPLCRWKANISLAGEGGRGKGNTGARVTCAPHGGSVLHAMHSGSAWVRRTVQILFGPVSPRPVPAPCRTNFC